MDAQIDAVVHMYVDEYISLPNLKKILILPLLFLLLNKSWHFSEQTIKLR